MVRFVRPNCSRTALTASRNERESLVLPAKTRIAMGRPAASPSRPNSICGSPRLPSRECPNRVSGQAFPSIQVLDRSNNAIPPGCRCRAASFFSIVACRANSQSIAAYTSSVCAPARSRSAPKLVSDHQRIVASFEAGATTLERINAYARSRSRLRGPSSSLNLSVVAMEWTAAIWPWARERSI